jgi:ankyrin repeat protein
VVVHPLVDQLLAAGMPVDNFRGCEVLQAAAHTRDRETVTKLLAAGAPVQVSKPAGEYEDCDALARGAEGGDPDIVKQLLAHHPDPNRISPYGPLLMAVVMLPSYVPGDRFSVRKTEDGRFLPPVAEIQRKMQQMRIDTVRVLLTGGANPRLAIQSGRTREQLLRERGIPEINRMLDAWDAAHPPKRP